jgi:hypothetical protein
MQSLEAIISLMVFAALCSGMLAPYAEQAPMDDSLYRYQLANDAWRVLYLRDGFRNLSMDSQSTVRDSLEGDMENIYGLTGLCTYLDGVQVAPQECRGAGIAEDVAVLHRVLYDAGVRRNVTFTLAKPNG